MKFDIKKIHSKTPNKRFHMVKITIGKNKFLAIQKEKIRHENPPTRPRLFSAIIKEGKKRETEQTLYIC